MLYEGTAFLFKIIEKIWLKYCIFELRVKSFSASFVHSGAKYRAKLNIKIVRKVKRMHFNFAI